MVLLYNNELAHLAFAVRGVAGECAAAGPAVAAVGQASRDGLCANIALPTVAVLGARGNTIAVVVGQGQATALRTGRVGAISRAITICPWCRLAVRIGAGDTDPGGAGVVQGTRAAHWKRGDLAFAVRRVARERTATGPAVAAVGQASRDGLCANIARPTVAVLGARGNTIAVVGKGQATALRTGRIGAVTRAIAMGPRGGLAVRIGVAVTDPGGAGVVQGTRAAHWNRGIRRASGQSQRDDDATMDGRSPLGAVAMCTVLHFSARPCFALALSGDTASTA
jgi:hypothetical protein